MEREAILDHFRRSGALLEGHYILRSGRHSRRFFQCALALQEMAAVERFGAVLADRVRGLAAATVVAPAMGGLVIGQETARQLGLRFLFVEKGEGGALVLRRGFRLSPGERVLVAEDVVTRGGRVRETIDIVEAAGAHVVAVAVLVDRSEGPLPFDQPLHSLIRLETETFAAEALPVDLAALPPVRPGS